MGYKKFKNTLDLSGKTKQQIIREVIMEPRSLKIEILKVIAIILVVTAATWTFSKASELIIGTGSDSADTVENYSIIGVISELDEDYVTLVEAEESIGNKNVTKTIYIAGADKIENPEYRRISLENLSVGETIVLQGKIVNGDEIIIERVINFGVL